MKPLSWPGRLYLWLGRRPSWSYIALYLAMIVGMPFVFIKMPDGFLSSTARYEASLASDGESLLHRIDRMTAPDLMNSLPRQVVVNPTDVIGSQVLFDSLVVTTQTASQDSSFWTVVSCNVSNVIHTARGITWFPHRQLRITMMGTPHRRLASVAVYQGLDNSAGASDIVLESHVNLPSRVDDAFASAAYRYAKASDGLSGYSTRSYWRMLYFSAITATTVGYGDVVPIRGKSRLLSGLEAVLGIVLIGLFLNSLAREIGDRAGGSPAAARARGVLSDGPS